MNIKTLNGPSYEIENNYQLKGYKIIAGTDEAGRGPIAGPVVAAAVILDKKNIKYEQDDKLVRGLDYYNRTVFEYIDKNHESQNTICAGGRYDFLFENLCDKNIPALGFAIGIERLLEYMNYNLESEKSNIFYRWIKQINYITRF